MLSFDITDRNIRVVKGVESNGKIKISSAATLNVDEGLIVNGHVKDVPNVATLVNGVLKKNKMPDKEAIVSISSNLTIFKEMNVAKVKTQELQKVVKQQMKAELNLDDSYSVSYIIVGDAERGDGGEPAYRILATACPYEIVNSYREVFKLLGISLKSVMIGCNCITKVLLADTKIRSKMPLLAVQIDNNFISLNLYEQGQLSFSRFASIDAADYGYSDDYVFEAVNENIFRMLQFHRSRNTGDQIENVIFYGDTHEYVRLTDELEKLDLKTSLINVPPQIHGHENLEFSLYANAIGAMFKRNKDSEKINLLETDLGTAVKNKIKDDSSGNIILCASLIAALVIVGGIWGVQASRANSSLKDVEKVETFINSESTKNKLKEQERLVNVKSQVEAYNTKIVNADAAFKSKPRVLGEKYQALIDLMKSERKAHEARGFLVSWGSYDNGVLTFDLQVDATDEYVQTYPSDFVDKIFTLGKGSKKYFSSISYSSYEVEKDDDGLFLTAAEVIEGKKRDTVKFSVAVGLKGEQSAYVPEETTEEESK